MDAVILHIVALRAHLAVQVRVVLRIKVLDNRHPAVGIVDKVAKAGRVNKVQTKAEVALLKIYSRTQ